MHCSSQHLVCWATGLKPPTLATPRGISVCIAPSPQITFCHRRSPLLTIPVLQEHPAKSKASSLVLVDCAKGIGNITYSRVTTSALRIITLLLNTRVFRSLVATTSCTLFMMMILRHVYITHHRRQYDLCYVTCNSIEKHHNCWWVL